MYYLCDIRPKNEKKRTTMTRTITIKHPSARMIQVFDSLQEKKRRQIEKLSQKKECVFTIKV